MPLQFRTFTNEDIPKMHKAFNLAFEDYFVNINLPYPDFTKRLIIEQNTSLDLSIGAFAKEELVGFIFTSIGIFNGNLTAYNGGTGVIPAYRGHRLSSQLYQRLIPLYNQASVSQCLLEVIVRNHPAINIYKQLGFEQSRYLKCFKCKKDFDSSVSALLNGLQISPNDRPDWQAYKSLEELQPAFQDSHRHLTKKAGIESFVEASISGKLVGYIIYQIPRGRISQIAVSPTYRRQGIGGALVRHISKNTNANGLNIINIDATAHGMISFLNALGFENYLDQYEMVKKI